jgi:transposase-like protein
MNTLPPTNLYKRHRFPTEISSHCLWLYFRFCLSYRDVEELMAERGIILTYEADMRHQAPGGPAFQARSARSGSVSTSTAPRSGIHVRTDSVG